MPIMSQCIKWRLVRLANLMLNGCFILSYKGFRRALTIARGRSESLKVLIYMAGYICLALYIVLIMVKQVYYVSHYDA